LKRGTKSLGKRSEFEALVQVKQTVNHSETTARNKFQKNKEKSLVDPSGGGETAGTLVLRTVICCQNNRDCMTAKVDFHYMLPMSHSNVIKTDAS